MHWDESFRVRKTALGAGYKRYLLTSIAKWMIGFSILPVMVLISHIARGQRQWSSPGDIYLLLITLSFGPAVRLVIEIFSRRITPRRWSVIVHHTGHGNTYRYDLARLLKVSDDVLRVEFHDRKRSRVIVVGAPLKDGDELRRALIELGIAYDDLTSS